MATSASAGNKTEMMTMMIYISVLFSCGYNIDFLKLIPHEEWVMENR